MEVPGISERGFVPEVLVKAGALEDIGTTEVWPVGD
jgi:hypothetical protein